MIASREPAMRPLVRSVRPGELGLEAVRLAFGTVWHQRTRPASHQFSYRAFFVAVPARVLLAPPSGNWLFGVNRRAVISVHKNGHSMGSAQGLGQALIETFGHQEVTLFCFARVLGYEFKPVSFWVAEDKVLAEVHNTFGERHAYLLHRELPLQAEKRFHVSPFCDVKGRYEFDIESSAQRFSAAIHLFDQEGLPALIKTRLSGKLSPVTLASSLRAILAYPLFSVTVIARIHWQALRLWSKKVPWFSKPVPPLDSLTHAIDFTAKND
jgi:uncharacterized protein